MGINLEGVMYLLGSEPQQTASGVDNCVISGSEQWEFTIVESGELYHVAADKVALGDLSFEPLVFSASGDMACGASVFYKCLASLLAAKWGNPYSLTLFWLCCCLMFSFTASVVIDHMLVMRLGPVWIMLISKNVLCFLLLIFCALLCTKFTKW